jgi:hypothetical protein
MRRLAAFSLLCLALAMSVPWAGFAASDSCRGHVCLCVDHCERTAEHSCHRQSGPVMRATCHHDASFLAGATPFVVPPAETETVAIAREDLTPVRACPALPGTHPIELRPPRLLAA